jgi:transcription elongation GreA/GreB family factor
MSRAFTRDGQEGEGLGVLPDRPISRERNLVTRRGLGLIERAIAAARSELAVAEAQGDRLAMGNASRDIRYWLARRASAEPIDPSPAAEGVRFGMAVTLHYTDDRQATWRIVGEDEADAASGRISHASAMARALFGKEIGETVRIGSAEAEIVGIEGTPEAP